MASISAASFFSDAGHEITTSLLPSFPTATLHAGPAAFGVIEGNSDALVDALQHHARAVPEIPDTGTLPGDMRAFLTALLRSRSEASRALAAVSGEIATNPELRQAWHRGLAGMLTGCLRQIVDRAVARGELPADSDVELLAGLPLSLLQNWRLEHRGQPDDAVVDRIVRQFYTPYAPR
jgi:AcrR family transcriptional regulator